MRETAKLVFDRYIDRMNCLNGLPELRSIIKMFAPETVLSMTEEIVKEYLDETKYFGAFNIDGFVNFRLRPSVVKNVIDEYVAIIIISL